VSLAARAAPGARVGRAGAALGLVLAMVLVGCGTPVQSAVPAATTGPSTPAPQTPMAVLSPHVQAALAAVQRRLAEQGITLEQSGTDYRPAEPGVVQPVPRAVFRVTQADPNAGWVVIYDLGQPDTAIETGRAFASYLGSGFGQTNYPRDAQFTLNQVGGALVFTWWSPGQSADPDRARAAFEAIQLVGQSVPIVR
jgi:hypothetical protein